MRTCCLGDLVGLPYCLDGKLITCQHLEDKRHFEVLWQDRSKYPRLVADRSTCGRVLVSNVVFVSRVGVVFIPLQEFKEVASGSS